MIVGSRSGSGGGGGGDNGAHELVARCVWLYDYAASWSSRRSVVTAMMVKSLAMHLD